MIENGLSSLFSKELIFIDEEAKDFGNLVNHLSQILEEKEYVKSSFKKALLEREALYPTGLRLETTGVAIPHTDEIHVLKDAIVIIKLKNPITVVEMATEDQKLDVKYVFMLLLKKEGAHMDVLQRLIEFFTDSEMMSVFEKENTINGIYELVSNFMKKDNTSK